MTRNWKASVAFVLLGASAFASAQSAAPRRTAHCEDARAGAVSGNAATGADPVCADTAPQPSRSFDKQMAENPLYKRQAVMERFEEAPSAFRFSEPQPLVQWAPPKTDSLQQSTRCADSRKELQQAQASGSGDNRKLANKARGDCASLSSGQNK